MNVAVTVLAIVVAILAVLVLGLLRSHALILRRLHDAGLDLGLDPDVPSAATGATPSSDGNALDAQPAVLRPTEAPVGRRAADVVGTAPDGGAIGVPTTDTDHDTLLLFLSADCTTCERFWDVLRPDAPAVQLPDGLRLVVVTKGPQHESPPAIEERAVSVPVVMSDDAWRDFDVPGSPYAVHVSGSTGRVLGEGTGGSWSQVADLLARATGELGYVAGGRRRKARRDDVAEQDTDAVLLAAGILPGDPSLQQRSDGSSPDADVRSATQGRP